MALGPGRTLRKIAPPWYEACPWKAGLLFHEASLVKLCTVSSNAECIAHAVVVEVKCPALLMLASCCLT